MPEMTIDDTICSLKRLTKPYLSHLIPTHTQPGLENAITILERVKRLQGHLQHEVDHEADWDRDYIAGIKHTLRFLKGEVDWWES